MKRSHLAFPLCAWLYLLVAACYFIPDLCRRSCAKVLWKSCTNSWTTTVFCSWCALGASGWDRVGFGRSGGRRVMWKEQPSQPSPIMKGLLGDDLPDPVVTFLFESSGLCSELCCVDAVLSIPVRCWKRQTWRTISRSLRMTSRNIFFREGKKT